MKKYIRTKISILCAVVLLLSTVLFGCWDSLDINEKDILTTICFDYKEEEIIIYIEIANTESGGASESGGNIGDKFIVVESRSKNLPEMRENLDAKLDKPVYLSGVRCLILTEDFANKYLIEYMYRLRSDENYRKRTITVITKEDPKELFKIAKEKKVSLGFYAEELFLTLEKLGESFYRSTIRLIENLSSPYTGILLPCLGINEKEFELRGYSVIRGDKVTGFLPKKESKGMIFLKAEKPKFSYLVPYKDLILTIKLELKKKKMTPLLEGEKISFDISTEFKATLLYGDKKTPYNFQEKDALAVAEILEDLLKEEITVAIERAQQEFDCDYLQFDDEFRIKYPMQFKNMKWEEEFPKIVTTVKTKVSLSTKMSMDYSSNEIK